MLASGYRTEARIIAHLAEVEARKLYAKDASEALFPYCTKRLGLSNSEAYHRITVARLARKFPIIFELIEQRALHLTALCLLHDYLTDENHREILAEASHKTKWQVEELIARRFPRADVVSRVSKLPTPRREQPLARMPQSASPTALSLLESPLPNPTPISNRPEAQTPDRRHTQQVIIEPTSESRYRIQLNASASLKEKLDLARALVSHANPSGDIVNVIERALDLLIESEQKQRFGQTKRPRRSKLQTRFVQTKSRSLRDQKREHIPNETRRRIVERDGLRCTFIAEDGHRCEAQSFLQIHHEIPWARGGRPDSENLRLLCAAHNHLRAEIDFGKAHISRKITSQRHQPAQPKRADE